MFPNVHFEDTRCIMYDVDGTDLNMYTILYNLTYHLFIMVYTISGQTVAYVLKPPKPPSWVRHCLVCTFVPICFFLHFI